MSVAWAVFRREWASFLAAPAVFGALFAFVLAVNVFTFQIAGFWQAGLADLTVFFDAAAWGLIAFMPLVSMRSFSHETQSGLLDILLTTPASGYAIAIGKVLAVWSLGCAALVLTAPLWIALSVVGAPDQGVIILGFVGLALLAGALGALGCAAAAIAGGGGHALIGALLACAGLAFLGLPAATEAIAAAAGADFAAGLAGLSPIVRVQALSRGLLEFSTIVYFAALIGLGGVWAGLALEARRGG